MERTHPDTPKQLKGASSELLAAVDLMARGFEVYRNVADHGTLDLIAYGLDGSILKIEVTTGYNNPQTDHIYKPPHKANSHRRDILAVMTPTGIIYLDKSGKPIEPRGRPDLDTPP